MEKIKTDIVIVGAGVAGCAAALFYAREGFKVAVIDRKKKTDYKANCAHYIQPAGLKTIQRLELDGPIEAAGGLQNKLNYWTASGWINYYDVYGDQEEQPYGYNIQRSVLDPLLRTKVMDEPNVQMYLNCAVRSIVQDENGRVTGVKTKDAEFEAKLSIAADGRFSRMATLTKNEVLDEGRNNRFSVQAYYKNIKLKSGNVSQTWMVDNGQVSAWNLDDDVVLLNIFFDEEVKDEWKKCEDLDTKLIDMIKELEIAPDFTDCERISDFVWMFNMTNMYRALHKDGMAFIGDAAMALDPMTGVGCAFSFKAAEFLFDSTKEALKNEVDLSESLDAYTKEHHACFKPHTSGIYAHAISNNKHVNTEFFDTLVGDFTLGRAYLDLIGRLITPQQFQMIYTKRLMEQRKLSNAA